MRISPFSSFMTGAGGRVPCLRDCLSRAQRVVNAAGLRDLAESLVGLTRGRVGSGQMGVGIVPKWHEDDDFWMTLAPKIFPERFWANTPSEVEQIVTLLGLKPGAALLDLCCGPGRHALELARRGYRVTGVDRTRRYLEEARKMAEKEGLQIEFLEDDMRRFSRPGAFEAVLNLYTSFGYFEDSAEDLAVLTRVLESLKQGGRLIMDLVGQEVFLRSFRPRDWREEGDLIVLEQRSLSPDQTWLENRWTVLKGGRRKEFRVSHRLYSRESLTALLQEAGFTSIKIYGDLAGGSYNEQAKRLIAVAQK